MVFVTQIAENNIFCEELTVKHYKNILKCCYGEQPNKQIFVETITNILAELTKTSALFYKNLSVIDLFCFLIDIRINSLGNSTDISFTKDNKKLNLELNLNDFKDYILSLKTNLDTTITTSNITIFVECPSSSRLLQLQTQNPNYISFIKRVETSAGILNVIDDSQAETLFDNLPPSVSIEILKYFKNVIDHISNANYLSKYGINEEQLTFVPSLDSLIWFTKLLFSESLSMLYENIYCLAHVAHLSAEYIENCVVGEYIYFVNCLKKTTKPQENSSDSNTENIDNQIGEL